MRHCPECRRPYRMTVGICPDCWTPLEPGLPPDSGELTLVCEANAAYEADMIETLLGNEGIPCLRVPAHGALPWALAGASPLASLRLYVRADLAPLALEIIAEVTDGGGD